MCLPRGARAAYVSGRAIVVLVLASLSLLAVGCGGDSEKARQEARAECSRHIGDLLDALLALDSRLDLGLSYNDYAERVGDAKVEYDRIDLKASFLHADSDESAKCRGAAIASERALDKYVEAQSDWHACIFDDVCGQCIYECDAADVEPALRRKWSTADRALGVAQRRLDEIAPRQ